MDYGDAFTFITKDDDWISKGLMGVVFALFLPFAGLGAIPLMGWAITIGRGVIRGKADPLPEWSELGSILVDGVKAVVILLIWNIPAWILGLIAGLVDAPIAQGLLSLCGAIYGLLVAFLTLGVFGLLADDQPFGKALNPLNAWQVVSANIGQTLVVWILAIATMIAATLIGTILCLVGVVPGWAYGFAVGGHLYGQLYREARQGGKMAL